MYRPRVGSYAVYEPPEEGWQEWQDQLAQVGRDLEVQGVEVVVAPEAVRDDASLGRVAAWFSEQGLDCLHALIVTWSFDHYTLELQQQLGLPVAVRAIPGIRTGSIVGTQQLGCVLADVGVPHRLYHGAPGDERPAREAAAFASACGIQRLLRGGRIGVIGRRTEGMTPTAVDEVEIFRLFGTRLLSFGLDEFEARAAAVDQREAEEEWRCMAQGARHVEYAPEHGIVTARNYLALQQMVAELRLNALTIGSYPKCQGTFCVPIAWLNERGVPTGCEGDVNSTLSMLILSHLSELPVHFGEMLAVDQDENSVVTSHCGCGSPSLANAEGFALQPVRLANSGVAIRFVARPGDVTFVNLVGRKGNYRLCALEGSAVPTGMVFEGNPLKFVLDAPFASVWRTVADGGFGHHWMTAYARVVPVLREFCCLSGVTGAFPGREGDA
jgi:L-fucose isomerase-like protein